MALDKVSWSWHGMLVALDTINWGQYVLKDSVSKSFVKNLFIEQTREA